MSKRKGQYSPCKVLHMPESLRGVSSPHFSSLYTHDSISADESVKLLKFTHHTTVTALFAKTRHNRDIFFLKAVSLMNTKQSLQTDTILHICTNSTVSFSFIKYSSYIFTGKNKLPFYLPVYISILNVTTESKARDKLGH